MEKDAELIRRHLEGDPRASRELIRRHETSLYNLAYRMLGNAEEARDAAQEIFLNVLQSLPYFRGECAFTTWLYRIASNECIGRSKRSRRRREREIAIDDDEGQVMEIPDTRPSSSEKMEQEERDCLLRRAIGELPEKYRMVLVLHYLEGLAYEEIVKVLLVPMGTVKTRLFRAKRLLRRKLQPDLI